MAFFSNIDQLLWRFEEQRVPKEILEPFPWIVWYLWKSINNFIFNGVDTPPHETLQLARQCWALSDIPNPPGLFPCMAFFSNIDHILFECPPARQCWALSDIPNPPGLFPCMAFFSNIDQLLWRFEEQRVPKEILEPFPWIVGYLWKSRNNFIFNGVDTPPHETLQLAIAEARNWKAAQLTPAIVMDIPGAANCEEEAPEIAFGQAMIRCQVDASWTHKERVTGLGFVLREGDKNILVGLKNGIKTASPLHAEAQALSWAMKMTRQNGYREIHFETDCTQLLKLVLKMEEWPSMINEVEDIEILSQSFDHFSISYIPRGNNQRADCLAKAARARYDTFTYVSVETSDWLPLASIPE